MLTFGQSLYTEVELLFQKKQYAKAEVLLGSFIKENSKDTRAIELLGDSYGYQEKWNEAITIFEDLISSYPSNANYHYKLGGVLGMKAININKIAAFVRMSY